MLHDFGTLVPPPRDAQHRRLRHFDTGDDVTQFGRRSLFAPLDNELHLSPRLRFRVRRGDRQIGGAEFEVFGGDGSRVQQTFFNSRPRAGKVSRVELQLRGMGHDATVDVYDFKHANLGDFLPLRNLEGSLITSITLPLNAKLAFEYVSRTPADKPIVCVALAQWNSGRTRLALGGYGKSPMLAMDGTEAEGIETAARNAFHEATDEWASAEYRVDVAATLAKRCLERIA